MEFNDCLRSIKIYFRLISAITIIAVISALVVTQFVLKEEYESTSTIILSGENNAILEKSSVRVFTNIAESDLVSRDVIQKLNLKYSVKEVRKLAEIDVDEETGIIKIFVRTTNPQLSNSIVYAFIDSLRKQTQLYISKTYINIIDAPSLATEPISPNMILNLLLSFVGGIMSGILTAILLTVKEQSSYSIFALNKLPGLFNIGSIPKIKGFNKKNGTHIFPSNSSEFDSLKSIRANLLFLLDRESINTIIITSRQKSEGKTTLAANIAVSFSQIGRSVLLIDCNFKKPSLYTFFKFESEIAEGDVANDQNVNGYVVKSIQNLGVDSVCDVMMPPPNSIVDYTLLISLIDSMERIYDLIILDCPPITTNADTLILSSIAKNVVIVADYLHLTHQNMEQSIQRFTQIGIKILGIVVNRAPKKKIF